MPRHSNLFFRLPLLQEESGELHGHEKYPSGSGYLEHPNMAQKVLGAYPPSRVGYTRDRRSWSSCFLLCSEIHAPCVLEPDQASNMQGRVQVEIPRFDLLAEHREKNIPKGQ